MRFWTAYAFLALNMTKAYGAAGAAGHGSLTDLFWPTVNVAILFGLLGWKLKGPLKDYFVNKSNEVANTLERADLKSKEAQLMLETEERKINNLSQEVQAINQQTENEVISYEKSLSKETEAKIHKLKADANSKILADKKAIMDDLNSQLLNEVILKTKSTIKTNKDYQTKVSSKLLQGL